MSLQKTSVLVKLTIKQWDGFRKDKQVAKDVDERYHTAGGAGNYNKRLFDKSVLNPIQKISGKTRSEHTRMTMPFAYDGINILPNVLYFDYTQMFRNFKGQFDVSVHNFVSQYPVYKAQQAQKLGALFNPDEYPSIDEIPTKFSMAVSFFPVPSEDHFLADLEDRDTLATELRNELADVQKNALMSLYERIKQMLDHAHERLSDPGNVFRDTLVENLEQLVSVLPGLNVFGDPILTEVHTRLRDELLIATPEDLRTDLPLRKSISNIAYDLSNLLSGGESA